jgi:hypothetical protein
MASDLTTTTKRVRASISASFVPAYTDASVNTRSPSFSDRACNAPESRPAREETVIGLFSVFCFPRSFLTFQFCRKTGSRLGRKRRMAEGRSPTASAFVRDATAREKSRSARELHCCAVETSRKDRVDATRSSDSLRLGFLEGISEGLRSRSDNGQSSSSDVNDSARLRAVHADRSRAVHQHWDVGADRQSDEAVESAATPEIDTEGQEDRHSSRWSPSRGRPCPADRSSCSIEPCRSPRRRNPRQNWIG